MKGIINEVLLPLAGRLGTLVSGVLIAQGADAGLAQQVEIGVIALALIAAELAVRKFWKKGS